MDLGDKTHWLATIDGSGDLIDKTTCSNTAESVKTFFARFPEPQRVTVVMEAGTHSPWLSRHIEDLGCEVLVANARKVRAIWQSDVKDDSRDCEMLARIGRFDQRLLHPIRHRGKAAQAALSILRTRDALVSARTSLISTCRGLVKSWGARLPKCSADSFSAAVVEDIPDELVPAVLPLVEQIGEMTQRIKNYNFLLRQITEKHYPEAHLLAQVSGVGPICSLAFVLTVEDPHRFERNRSIGAFLGLTPRRDQSGDTDKALPITKAGDGFVRRLLAQSAQYILGPHGPDCDLRRHGLKIAQKGKAGKKKAVTAVSRKLAVLLLHLWKTGDVYDPFHKQTVKQHGKARKAA
jgi:transposase